MPQALACVASQPEVPQTKPLQALSHSQPLPPVVPRSRLQSLQPSWQLQVPSDRQLALAPQPAAGHVLGLSGTQVLVAVSQTCPVGHWGQPPPSSSLHEARTASRAAIQARVCALLDITALLCRWLPCIFGHGGREVNRGASPNIDFLGTSPDYGLLEAEDAVGPGGAVDSSAGWCGCGPGRRRWRCR